MFCVYVLHSERDGMLYTGFSNDLKNRIKYHEQGKVISTKNRRPVKLIYFEAYLIEKDAKSREVLFEKWIREKIFKEAISFLL